MWFVGAMKAASAARCTVYLASIWDFSHDKFGSVLIDGYNIGGMGFDRYQQIQRAGLALATKPGGAKALVIAFGGGEGQGSPSGWVIAFDVFTPAHGGAPANVWCSVPNNDSGSGSRGGRGVERRCLGNLAQSRQSAGGGQSFRTVPDCTATSSGGNFVQICQRSTASAALRATATPASDRANSLLAAVDALGQTDR